MKAAANLLSPDRSFLVVVDVQEKLLPPIGSRDAVVARCVLLMRAARAMGVPVLLTTQYARGLGATVPEILAEAPDATPIDKASFGCFGCEPFRAALSERPGRDQILLAGIEAHICVLQTALGALAEGFTVHVACDAVGARGAEDRQLGLRRIERAGAVLSSAEMAIYEWLRSSDNATFKQVLPLLRLE